MALIDANVATIVVGVLTFLGSVLALNATRKAGQRTNDIEKLKVYADAYEGAQQIQVEIVKQLREELAHLRAIITDERREASLTNERLRASVSELERYVQKLETLLRAAGVELPPAPVLPA